MSEESSVYFDKFYHYLEQGENNEEARNKRRRELAVGAALSLLHAHAHGGSNETHPSQYREQIGPLADAIQAALKQ
ncbi:MULTISPECIES: hypothetical protein [Halomonadaceae]|uniref:hypothetical protein n=1 Tax=Halomonadaceae TaxID=28256 RepID=UPI0015978751|nr:MULTISPECIES: hypothetical protein [Halomonas]QJQ95306.1 hypothetical protein HIO72_08485 [Halomonas sp. PA5]